MIIQEDAFYEKHLNVNGEGSRVDVQNSDDPPPYEEIAGTPSSSYSATSSSQLPGPTTVLQPGSLPLPGPPTVKPLNTVVVASIRPPQGKTVNVLSLYSRNDALAGTYAVDPTLTSPLSPDTRNYSVEQAHARDVFGSLPGEEEDGNQLDESGGWLRRRSTENPQVNAAFRTRHGNIDVILSIVESYASPQADVAPQHGTHKTRGRLVLSSRHGRITVKLTEIHPSRCVDLDVSTRDGDITVYFPPEYNGVVAFRTRRGSSGITFLPAFAAHAEVVHGNDNEMLVSVSSTASHTGVSAPQEGADYCIIGTRDAKITIGLHGQDDGSTVVQSKPLVGRVGGRLGTSTKQLGSMIQASTKAGIKALDATFQVSASARESALQVRESVLQVRECAMDNASRVKATATQSTQQAKDSVMQARSQLLGRR